MTSGKITDVNNQHLTIVRFHKNSINTCLRYQSAISNHKAYEFCAKLNILTTRKHRIWIKRFDHATTPRKKQSVSLRSFQTAQAHQSANRWRYFSKYS